MRKLPRLRTVGVVYLLLLVASFVVRGGGGGVASPGPGVSSVELREVTEPGAEAGGSRGPVVRGERRVRLAYRDLPATNGGVQRGLPIVLLHGSPGSKEDFRRVLDVLNRDHRVLIPDLPGFGESEHQVADYSIRAHADYVRQWQEELGVGPVHMVGFSMGGGVALEFSGAAPERLASLILLSSIGVQEMELLGDYQLNHAIHLLQWGVISAALVLVPHFGLFDGGALSIPYARNFVDTDQRPLRARLRALEVPALILHGRGDVLVPFAAAREHERLVPQSTLIPFDSGNHFLLFVRSDDVAKDILDFTARVESGRARTRSTASPERVAAARRPFDPASVPPTSGFALLVFCFLAALATFASEDLTCIAVGALVGDGRIPFLAGTLACLVGIYVGDLLLFLAGRVLGRRALGIWPLNRLLTEARVARSSKWLEERGAAVILASRFLPGARLPTYFAAGVLRTGFWRFNFWFLLAAALWTPLVVFLASRFGGTIGGRFGLFQHNLLLGLVATLVAVWVFVRGGLALASARGRALLRGRIHRILRWEYWPRWMVYAPVVPAVLFHGLRRASPLAFTASNPAIPDGGLIGESKSAILRGLAAGPGAEHIPRTLVLTGGIVEGTESLHRREALKRFVDRLVRPWPLVVKPDIGQRGDDVRIVRSKACLLEAMDGLAGLVLVQEFCPGPEFGVFYARQPGAAEGRLLSVSRKVPPVVVGDGVRTLERLILADLRLAAQGRPFLDRQGEGLARVPVDREVVALGELGTHCRGAAFFEGRDLATDALRAEIERVARGYGGFFYGRFDLKAESEAALRCGEFQILELNGVTSEPAHIYDPCYGPLRGWRELIAAWCLAVDIGIQNKRAGARVSHLADLWRSLRSYRHRGRLGGDGVQQCFEIPATGAETGGSSRGGGQHGEEQ